MNVQQIKYVIAVSKTGSFGQAAEMCFVTQSTLSTMVARFESELGITIFDRKTKPIRTTSEGSYILQQLKVISNEMNNLKEVVKELKGEVIGDLKIGAIPTVAPYLFPYFLQEFIKKIAYINFEISEIPTEKIVENLLSRDLDIGIAAIPLKHPDLIELPLYQEPFLLFDKVDKNTNKKFTISEIDYKRLWLLEEGHCMRNQVEKICELRQERMINGNLIYKSGTIGTLMKFVNNNNGVTLLPQLATLDLSQKEQEHLRVFEDPTPVREIGLIVHKHFVKKNLLEELQKNIQEKILPLIGMEEKETNVISPL